MFLAHPLIILTSDDKEVNQDEGVVKMNVERKKQKKGKILVPWKLLPQVEDSIYTDMKGKYVSPVSLPL